MGQEQRLQRTTWQSEMSSVPRQPFASPIPSMPPSGNHFLLYLASLFPCLQLLFALMLLK